MTDNELALIVSIIYSYLSR